MNATFPRRSTLVSSFVVLLISSTHTFGETTDADRRARFDRLITAVVAADRDAFLSNATELMKENLTPAVMDTIQRDLGELLEKEHEASYLGQLKQQGHQVELWKVSFKDGHDDILLRVVLKDEKLAGFFRQ